MNTGYATIITPISGEEHAEALKHFLRTEVQPLFDRDDPREILKCRPRFPFDRIATLHFCSFVVLDGDAEFPPCLVFEATFDGARDHLLDALVEFAPGAIDEIYRHCKGYPASGLAIPELVKTYLARHDKGAHTFYLGSPGRTVAQIKGEAQVRDAVANSVCRPWSRHKTMPATFAGILQELGDVIRNEPGHRWAQQTAAVPWEVAWRKAVPIAAVLAVLGTACLLGWLVVGSSGLCGPATGHSCVGYMDNLLFNPLNMQWVVDHIRNLNLLNLLDREYICWFGSTEDFDCRFDFALSNFVRLLVLIAVWAGLRFIELGLRLQFEDPRRQSFWLRVFLHILIILRYFFVVLFVGFSILALAGEELPNAEKFFLSMWRWKPSHLQAIPMLIGAGFVFLLLQHWATSLKLAVQFKELEPAQEIRRRLLVDTLRVGMVVVAAFALLVFTRSVFFLGDDTAELQIRYQPLGETRTVQLPPAAPLPDGATLLLRARQFLLGLEQTFFVAIMKLLELAVYALVGLIVAYAIGCLLFVALRFKERIEAKRFSGADGLAAFDNSSACAREEGGINTYQNHLVSLTHVKPGLLRALFLRLTLFAVGLLSRFWYNNGKLGGIPTILSARWVLIDGGRRLLFLDHYSGAWNNYLNEFIDMTAVFGLNAIWTNTFIKARGSQYGFPETEYYLWKGAQVERPFKAYVRHSQVETIVWYSAYPTVSTVNVNTNTEVRRSLFMPPVSREIDSLLQNL